MIVSKEENRGTMAEVVYERTAAEIDGGEDFRYTTYGIVAMDKERNVVARFADVSTDRALVDEIVRRCNAGQLDALHLEDVLLDFLE